MSIKGHIFKVLDAKSMSKICGMWKLDGKCAGELVRIHPKIYVASRCNLCGNHSYNHLSMEQLQKHKHRNSDLHEEYMERCWDEHELELKDKETAQIKKAADAKSAVEDAAKAAKAVADAKKLIYISRLDEIYKNKVLDKEKATLDFRKAYEVLVQDSTQPYNLSKLDTLAMLERYNVTNKIAMLMASGLPALIKCMSTISEHDDEIMSRVRHAASKVKSLWRVAIISSPTVMRLVKPEDDVSDRLHTLTGKKKRGGKVPEADRRRLVKKFKTAVVGA